MAKLVGTVARVGKGGIMEHSHDSFGWHWACAGHRDAGEIHAAAKASTPTFAEGFPAGRKADYLKALNREEGFVSRIPSKAKAKA